MSQGRKTSILKYMLLLFVIAVVFAVVYFEGGMNEQNAAALAISYKYGFLSRGFVGTILAVLYDIGINLYTYRRILLFSAAATVFLYILIFILYYCLLIKCKEQNISYMKWGILFLSFYMFSEYMTVNNFGRLDEYLMIITVISLILLVLEKVEWLLIPLCVVAVCVHSGFVFTNAAIILIFLIWKIHTHSGTKKIKYMIILAGTFITISALFLYFQLFQKPVSMEVYNQVLDIARQLSPNGPDQINGAYSLLNSELLKQDVYSEEWIWHKVNYIEFPFFILFYLPYIILGYKFFRKLIRGAEKKRDKWMYLLLALGIGTILPEMILKVDYGRWMFCIVFYYLTLLLIMLACGDEYFICILKDSVAAVRKKYRFWWILFIYPIIFLPFRDVYISDITTWLTFRVAEIFGVW